MVIVSLSFPYLVPARDFRTNCTETTWFVQFLFGGISIYIAINATVVWTHRKAIKGKLIYFPICLSSTIYSLPFRHCCCFRERKYWAIIHKEPGIAWCATIYHTHTQTTCVCFLLQSHAYDFLCCCCCGWCCFGAATVMGLFFDATDVEQANTEDIAHTNV